MTFSKSLRNGKKAEELVASYLLSTNIPTHLRFIGSSLSNKKSLAKIQRLAGDIRVVHPTKGIVRYEVKRDCSAIKYGNLFLEQYSDTGERTGNVTIGWFDREGSKFDWYVWHFVEDNSLFFVRRQELLDYINPIKSTLTVKPMVYNQQQYNRSTGYLIAWRKVLNNVKSAMKIQL